MFSSLVMKGSSNDVEHLKIKLTLIFDLTLVELFVPDKDCIYIFNSME